MGDIFTNQVASSKILGAMATKMVATWRVVLQMLITLRAVKGLTLLALSYEVLHPVKKPDQLIFILTMYKIFYPGLVVVYIFKPEVPSSLNSRN